MTDKKKKDNSKGNQHDELSDEYSDLKEKGYSTHKYKDFPILYGPGMSTNIIDEFLSKINNNESLAISITAPPGKGKTYFAISLGMLLDKLFKVTDAPKPDPREDDGQVSFDRTHFMHLTGENSPLKRGQVVVLDESHFGVGSRSWANRDQQKTTNYVSAVRSRGLVIIVVVLHLAMVDKQLRNFVFNYEINIQRPGVGTVYRTWIPRGLDRRFTKKIGELHLPLPDHEICSVRTCLTCRHLQPKRKDIEICDTIRARYERRKKEFLDESSAQSLEEETKKLKYTTFDEAIRIVGENKGNLPIKKSGGLHVTRFRSWIKEIGIVIRYADVPLLVDKVIQIYLG